MGQAGVNRLHPVNPPLRVLECAIQARSVGENIEAVVVPISQNIFFDKRTSNSTIDTGHKNKTFEAAFYDGESLLGKYTRDRRGTFAARSPSCIIRLVQNNNHMSTVTTSCHH